MLQEKNKKRSRNGAAPQKVRPKAEQTAGRFPIGRLFLFQEEKRAMTHVTALSIIHLRFDRDNFLALVTSASLADSVGQL